ncbi:MAG TPA: Mur ligase family protein [Candidatus Paceibacterota bacterium]
MLIKTVLPFTDFLWILQKDEYENLRYLYWLKRFYFRRNFVVTEKLVYTLRTKITLSAAILLWIVSLIAMLVITTGIISILLILALWFLLIPLFVGLANFLFVPLFALGHYRERTRATRIVREHKPMQIIAVVGSYGKTTTKHFLYDLLRFNYRTQMIPGTINTTSGIAAWVPRELRTETEVLIVEMDSYHKGGIAQSAAITPPDFAIITSIGEQHMQRFGNQATLVATLGEIITLAKPNTIIIGDKKTLEYVGHLQNGKTFVEVDTSHLAYAGAKLHTDELSQSNKENLARALEIASRLSVPLSFVEDTVLHLQLPDRRQKVTDVYGYEGIDDSYNISLSTARAGLAAARSLAGARKKKLLVIAAGIPELGPDELDGNQKLGASIAAVADHTIVFNSMFVSEIILGLGDTRYTLYKKTPSFLIDTKVFPKEEWVVLLEPKLPDLYY